tara:strand:- start:9942 stop:10661 length:720 start_codon:yes stop_codon:yes gene_type:complete
MGFLSDLGGVVKDVAGIAAPIVGGIFGGAPGSALGSAIGGAIAGGGSGGVRAAGQSTEEQLAAIREAQERTEQGAVTSQQFLQPFAGVGQQGIDLAGFLGDPRAQAQLAFNNPLFNLSRQALTEDINQNAASRGRITAGDTLERLQSAGAVAAQPFIDRQRQDILSLLNLGQNVAGQQVGIEQGTTRQLTDLITGAGATQAAGTIAEQNAETARRGNILDIGAQLVGNKGVQDLIGGLF